MGAHRRSPGFPRPDGGEQAAAISQRNHDCTFAASLWATTIFERGHERPVLMLTLHHALHDAQSLGFLAADIQAAYHGYLLRLRSQLSYTIHLTIAAHDGDPARQTPSGPSS